MAGGDSGAEEPPAGSDDRATAPASVEFVVACSAGLPDGRHSSPSVSRISGVRSSTRGSLGVSRRGAAASPRFSIREVEGFFEESSRSAGLVPFGRSRESSPDPAGTVFADAPFLRDGFAVLPGALVTAAAFASLSLFGVFAARVFAAAAGRRLVDFGSSACSVSSGSSARSVIKKLDRDGCGTPAGGARLAAG